MNPYKRAFLINFAVDENDFEHVLLNILADQFPDMLINLFDMVLTQNHNLHAPRNKQKKNIINRKQKRKQKESMSSKMYTVPDKDGKLKNVMLYY